MTLGINTAFNEGGEFLPILKYNSDAGRLFRVDRSQDSTGAFISTEVELPQGTNLAFDFGSIEVGWALLAAGMAPSWAMQPLRPGAAQTVAPSREHRQGFRMRVWNPNLGVRELASTAKTMVGAIDDLHTLFERAPEAAQGLIPVAMFSGVTPMVRTTPGGKKTTYRPEFVIQRWIERGAALGERTVPPPNPMLATRQPPPQVQPAQQWDGGAAVRPANPRHVPPPPGEWDARPAMVAQPGRDTTIEDEIPF